MHKLSIVFAILSAQFIFGQEQKPEEKKPEELQEVVIEKETKTFTNKNGNIKVDVANSIYKMVPSVMDILEKLPKVQISPDKQSITLVGKGSPLLYIDNQKADINDLNSLAVEDIKTIEVINNPSSKYEANGRAVILITLKLGKKEGYKVVVSENSTFKKYFNNFSGINVNLKTGKLEFKANFNYNQIKVWEKHGNDFSIPDYGIQSNYSVMAVTKRPQFMYGGGVFYKISEDDYFSANFSRRSQDDTFDIITNTFNQDQNAIDNINTLNVNNENRAFTNTFLNYNHKIKSWNTNLFTGFQYSNFHQEMASEIYNDYNDSGFELSQNRDQAFDIDVLSGRVDLEKKFKNDIRLELGGLYLQANADSDFEIENTNPPATNASSYIYKEQNIAAYSQFSGSYKKINYTAGIRAENTIVKGKYDSENTLTVDKNYINLFPKAQLEMVIDSSNTISMNYAKSISRPDFSSTSQITTYINPYFVWSDNINLNPTITDEISISYQYKDKSVKLAYYKTSNPVYYGATYDDSQNLLTFITMNFEKEANLNLELTLPFKYKFWTAMNVLSLSQNKMEDKLAQVNKAKPNLYYYSNHIFSLPKKFELYLTGWGLTKQKMGVFEKNALFSVNAAISKTFFKKLDCSVSWNDIFRKMNFKENFTFNNVSAKGVYYTDSRLVSFAVRYSFGQIKKSEFVEKSIDENSGRIK